MTTPRYKVYFAIVCEDNNDRRALKVALADVVGGHYSAIDDNISVKVNHLDDVEKIIRSLCELIRVCHQDIYLSYMICDL
jgi:hypothetical protein